MRYYVTHEDVEYELVVEDLEEGGYAVTIGDLTYTADLTRLPGEDIFSLILDGKSFELLATEAQKKTRIVEHGQGLELKVESDRERNARLIAAEGGGDSGEVVRAVMPGIVVSVAVAVGDAVKPGTPLLVLEAMKMENEIRATSIGVVAKIAVAKGQTVNGGDVLIEIVPAS